MIFSLGVSSPGWIRAQFSKSLEAITWNLSRLTGSSSSLLNKIFIMSNQYVWNTSNLLQTPFCNPVMNLRTKFSDCILKPGRVSGWSSFSRSIFFGWKGFGEVSQLVLGAGLGLTGRF